MKSYTYQFTTPKSAEEVFHLLLDVKRWWSGFYGETFVGTSQRVNDEFTFSAGDGMHVSTQRLVELSANKKVAWLVTESNLSFLSNPHEWEKSTLSFELTEANGKTNVTFTHVGLEPHIECYESCSNAWSQYLSQLEKHLNA